MTRRHRFAHHLLMRYLVRHLPERWWGAWMDGLVETIEDGCGARCHP